MNKIKKEARKQIKDIENKEGKKTKNKSIICWVILIAVGIFLLFGNISIVLWCLNDNKIYWLTLISGWVSGIATVLVGLIALWQNKRYKEYSDRIYEAQQCPRMRVDIISIIHNENLKDYFEENYSQKKICIAGYREASKKFLDIISDNQDFKFYILEVENCSPFTIFDFSLLDALYNREILPKKIYSPYYTLQPLEKAYLIFLVKNDERTFDFYNTLTFKNSLMKEYFFTFRFGFKDTPIGNIGNVDVQKIHTEKEWETEVNDFKTLFNLIDDGNKERKKYKVPVRIKEKEQKNDKTKNAIKEQD